MATEHHLTVPRTARYYTLGGELEAPHEVWFACHGYGQLAGRFIRHFAPIAGPARLIVAPEALSRFYHEMPRERRGADARIGASWMTREDRLAEIGDHVRYLDQLYATIFEQLDRESVRVVAFGFSQGVATVSRWLAHGTARADRLIAWAGQVPHDVALSASPIARLPLTLVVGDADEFISADAASGEAERLERAGLAVTLERFAGGHVVEADTLARIAG